MSERITIEGQQLLISYCTHGMVVQQIVEQLEEPIVSAFPSRNAFESNKKIICQYMILGLEEGDRLLYNMKPAECSKAEETRRAVVRRRILTLVNNLRDQFYGKPETFSPEKKLITQASGSSDVPKDSDASAVSETTDRPVNDELDSDSESGEEVMPEKKVRIAKEEVKTNPKSLDTRRNKAVKKNPDTLDEVYTSAEAVLALICYLLSRLSKEIQIMEPTSGEGHISSVLRDAGWDVLENDINRGGEDFLTMEIPKSVGAIVANPPFAKKREMTFKIMMSGLPFAILLPTRCVQAKGMNALFQSLGVTVAVLVPAPKFWVNGKRQNVVDCSWFIGNFSHQEQGKIETLFWATTSSIPRAPSSIADVMDTQASQAWEYEDEPTSPIASPRSPRSPRMEELMLSSGLICDKCGQAVDDEQGFAGVCQGENCDDVHLCGNCAMCIDGNLTQVFCSDCLTLSEEYTASTYADIVASQV